MASSPLSPAIAILCDWVGEIENSDGRGGDVEMNISTRHVRIVRRQSCVFVTWLFYSKVVKTKKRLSRTVYALRGRVETAKGGAGREFTHPHTGMYEYTFIHLGLD